jgi:hypothetical protein
MNEGSICWKSPHLAQCGDFRGLDMERKGKSSKVLKIFKDRFGQ